MKDATIAPAHRASRDRWILAGILAVGVFLRVSTIDTRGLWLDEAVSLDQANRTLAGTIATQVGGVHPPLFHILMHFWIQLVGTGEVALRSFALLFGVAAIAAAWWAGRVLIGPRVGLLAAAIVAVSPYQVWYSQEARMYTMMLFFAMLSLGFLGLAIREGTPGRWTAYFAVTILGLYSHYFFAFLVAGEVVYVVVFEVFGRLGRMKLEGTRRSSWRHPWRAFSDVPLLGPWLVATVAMAVTLGAWVAYAVVLPQFAAGGSPLIGSITSSGLGYGQLPPSFAVRFNDVVLTLVELTAGFHPSPVMFGLVATWPLLIYVMLLMLGRISPLRRETIMLIWCSSGMLMVWALGQWQGQVLASRYFMALSAPVVLLGARLLDLIPARARTAMVIAGVALALVGWADQSIDPANMMRYDDREAIAYVAGSQRPGDVIVYEPFYTDVLFNYYLPKSLVAYEFPQRGVLGEVRNSKSLIGQDLSRVTAGSKRVWLVLGFQDIAALRGDAYNTTEWLLRNGFTRTLDRTMTNVEVLRFDAAPAPTTAGGTP
jgi:mannosyltransferase